MENFPVEKSTFTFETAGNDQLHSASKWSKFIGVVFIIFGSVLILSTVLLIANFEVLMNEVIKLNGVTEEMIDMLEKGGKYFIAFALILSAVILFINGVLLYRFGNFSSQFVITKNENSLTESFEYLKKYIYFSFILATISTVLSLISMFTFFGSSH